MIFIEDKDKVRYDDNFRCNIYNSKDAMNNWEKLAQHAIAFVEEKYKVNIEVINHIHFYDGLCHIDISDSDNPLELEIVFSLEDIAYTDKKIKTTDYIDPLYWQSFLLLSDDRDFARECARDLKAVSLEKKAKEEHELNELQFRLNWYKKEKENIDKYYAPRIVDKYSPNRKSALESPNAKEMLLCEFERDRTRAYYNERIDYFKKEIRASNELINRYETSIKLCNKVMSFEDRVLESFMMPFTT